MKRSLVLSLTLAFLLAGAALAASGPLDGWQSDSPYNRLFNPKTVQTLQGTVLSIDRDLHPLPGMASGFGAVIQTEDGRKVHLHIGPTWFTQNFRDDWRVQVGDRVEVRGSVVTLQGNTVMMVNWGRKGEHVMTVRTPEGRPVWDVKIEGF